ncbi:hypothetical protein TYRP_006822 [Tyrophagus putrescentiae]|nr:hypothetical protein TYRP_006822 [Tyrophagus putrescentiae]
MSKGVVVGVPTPRTPLPGPPIGPPTPPPPPPPAAAASALAATLPYCESQSLPQTEFVASSVQRLTQTYARLTRFDETIEIVRFAYSVYLQLVIGEGGSCLALLLLHLKLRSMLTLVDKSELTLSVIIAVVGGAATAAPVTAIIITIAAVHLTVAGAVSSTETTKSTWSAAKASSHQSTQSRKVVVQWPSRVVTTSSRRRGHHRRRLLMRGQAKGVMMRVRMPRRMSWW